MKQFILFFTICCVSCSSDEASKLPIINIEKEYSEEKLNIHEIADIEYIPLQTSDKSLLSKASYYSISDKYLITEDSGTIFFFERENGKFLWKFCREGQSGEEYSYSIRLIVDFAKEECLIYDFIKNKFFVYDFYGNFKRSFSIKDVMKEFTLGGIYEYDKDYLIGYNSHFQMNLRMEDSRPYYLISKQDGQAKPFNIEIKDRINSCVHMDIVTSEDGSGGFKSPIFFWQMTPLLKNGEDILLADYALDTLYSIQRKGLKPIAVQTPSVKSNKIPFVISPDLYSDTYLAFYAIKVEYISSDSDKPMREAPYLFWNRKTGKVFKYKLYDSNILTDKDISLTTFTQHLPQNCAIAFLRPDFLIEQYKNEKLSGELKDIASKLEEDDNWVVVLSKFK